MLALWLTTAAVPTAAHAQRSLSAPEQEPAPATTPRGTHLRWTHTALGGVMFAIRRPSPFTAVGATVGFDTAFHPHHEVGVRISDSAHIPFEPGGPDIIGQWISVATDYRWHPDLVTGTVVPYLELVGGAGYYTGCLLGDSCGGVGMHGEIGAGGELVIDPYVSLVFGAHFRVLAGLFANGVPATLEPVALAGLRWG